MFIRGRYIPTGYAVAGGLAAAAAVVALVVVLVPRVQNWMAPLSDTTVSIPVPSGSASNATEEAQKERVEEIAAEATMVDVPQLGAFPIPSTGKLITEGPDFPDVEEGQVLIYVIHEARYRDVLEFYRTHFALHGWTTEQEVPSDDASTTVFVITNGQWRGALTVQPGVVDVAQAQSVLQGTLERVS